MIITKSPGVLVSRVVSANTTNSTSVKTKAGKVIGWKCSNVNAATRYLKVYDKAGAPNVGTDTPALTIGVPPAGGDCYGLFPDGIDFTNGIGFGIVTGSADNDSTAPAAGEIVVNLFYI